MMNENKMDGLLGSEPFIENLNDDLLLTMEGRWYLQFSGCPLWQKSGIHTVSFNFHIRHKGEDLVLEDRVEYIKNGKMRFRLGFDYPVEGIRNTFKWKGKGANRTFRNHFEVTIINERFMVLFFEKTLTSPTSIDIVTRAKTITKEMEDEIYLAVSRNSTLVQYLTDVEKINHLGAKIRD